MCLLLTGKQPRWDESEVNEFLPVKGSAQRSSKPGSVAQGLESEEGRRRGGRPESSAQEEADDIFESEFMMLKDLWNFDSMPFPVSKQVGIRQLCHAYPLVRQLTCCA